MLALTVLRHGEESDEFQVQLAITDQLLGRLPVDDPLQLQGQVEIGLQQIGMHAEEARQVAQRLLATGKGPIPPSQMPSLPAGQLHGTAAAPPSVSSRLPTDSSASTPIGSKPVETIAVDLPSATDLAMRLKQHHRLGEEQHVTRTTGLGQLRTEAPLMGPREARIHHHLSELPFGSWFEFVDPSTGQITQRKLAWHSSMSGRCLLVSRRGQWGEEMTLAQLAHEIARGHVCEMPAQRESLIDRAWRGLMGSLRQPIGARRPNPHEPASR